MISDVLFEENSRMYQSKERAFAGCQLEDLDLLPIATHPIATQPTAIVFIDKLKTNEQSFRASERFAEECRGANV